MFAGGGAKIIVTPLAEVTPGDAKAPADDAMTTTTTVVRRDIISTYFVVPRPTTGCAQSELGRIVFEL